jgi:hypothetical protein
MLKAIGFVVLGLATLFGFMSVFELLDAEQNVTWTHIRAVEIGAFLMLVLGTWGILGHFLARNEADALRLLSPFDQDLVHQRLAHLSFDVGATRYEYERMLECLSEENITNQTEQELDHRHQQVVKAQRAFDEVASAARTLGFRVKPWYGYHAQADATGDITTA